MVGVSGLRIGRENVLEQTKTEATLREKLENGDDSPPFNARCVSRLLHFLG